VGAGRRIVRAVGGAQQGAGRRAFQAGDDLAERAEHGPCVAAVVVLPFEAAAGRALAVAGGQSSFEAEGLVQGTLGGRCLGGGRLRGAAGGEQGGQEQGDSPLAARGWAVHGGRLSAAGA